MPTDSGAANVSGGQGEASATPAAPSISLPKGGAIRGMGGKFAANPVTGTGSMSVPIPTSPGLSGFGPQLSLSYDIGAGNGPFGFGWNFSLTVITGITDKGLSHYLEAEKSGGILHAGAVELAPEFKKQPCYFIDLSRFGPGGRINATVRCLSRA